MTTNRPEDAQMTDPTPDLNPGTGVRPRRGGQSPTRPRWVNVFGIAVIVLVLLFLALHFTGFVPTHQG
jgi:hypothetical protein